MIFVILALFAYALYLAYQIGRYDGISQAYDYIAENVEEFLESIKNGNGR